MAAVEGHVMILTSSSAIAALPYPLDADLGYGASLPMGYHASGSVHNVRMEDAYNNNSGYWFGCAGEGVLPRICGSGPPYASLTMLHPGFHRFDSSFRGPDEFASALQQQMNSTAPVFGRLAFGTAGA
ncbi:hypothetical protein D9619_002371 [Psilocybe cf. subviscida]|uniref:Uncharacterized protein n=1 Tax=Psilocybe cf. subviscida TaxID=2480587 RepID=A0A8H5EUP5_9AGAR|nr:hypothetical protein D9619_002371 [Psilocybe cf. subviscida]